MNKKIIQRISLLILLFVLPVAYPVNDVHAQDVRVTIRMDKVRMEQVMNEIERQTKYLFGSADNVDVNRIVTVQVVDVRCGRRLTPCSGERIYPIWFRAQISY